MSQKMSALRYASLDWTENTLMSNLSPLRSSKNLLDKSIIETVLFMRNSKFSKLMASHSRSLMITIPYTRWKTRSIRRSKRAKEVTTSNKTILPLSLISLPTIKLFKMRSKKWTSDLTSLRLSRTHLSSSNRRWITPEESIGITSRDSKTLSLLLRKRKSSNSYLRMSRIWYSMTWSLESWNKRTSFQRKSLKN